MPIDGRTGFFRNLTENAICLKLTAEMPVAAKVRVCLVAAVRAVRPPSAKSAAFMPTKVVRQRSGEPGAAWEFIPLRSRFCPDVSKFRPKQDDHRGIIYPDQNGRQRTGHPVNRRRIAVGKIESQQKIAAHKQYRGHH